MSLRIAPERPVAFAALALLGLAAGYWLLSGVAAIDPGLPSYKAGAVVRLEAAVPEIAAFDKFHVNELNPFVPLQERMDEEGASPHGHRTPRGIAVTPQPPPVTRIPVKDPVKVSEPPRPAWAPPRVTAAPANAPECVGLLAPDGKEVLMVRGAGDTAVSTISVGESVGGWKLVAIENGNQARFADPAGVEQVFPIGTGDLSSGGLAVNTPPPITSNVPKAAPAPKAPTAPQQGKPPGPPGIPPGGPQHKRPGLPPRQKSP